MLSKNVCDGCPDKGKCHTRSSVIPRETTLRLSKREEALGEKKPHYLMITKEVGLFFEKGASGDGCRTIQELMGEGDWSGERYLRLGYYVYNPEKGTWRWGGNTPMLDEEELSILLKRARKEGIISF